MSKMVLDPRVKPENDKNHRVTKNPDLLRDFCFIAQEEQRSDEEPAWGSSLR
jgi:hypothetical protein